MRKLTRLVIGKLSTAKFEVVFELTLDLVGQGRALRDHPVGEYRVVRIDELVE